jgi:hypothetical protein
MWTSWFLRRKSKSYPLMTICIQMVLVLIIERSPIHSHPRIICRCKHCGTFSFISSGRLDHWFPIPLVMIFTLISYVWQAILHCYSMNKHLFPSESLASTWNVDIPNSPLNSIDTIADEFQRAEAQAKSQRAVVREASEQIGSPQSRKSGWIRSVVRSETAQAGVQAERPTIRFFDKSIVRRWKMATNM